MKYNNTHYLELPRAIFTECYNDLSHNAKWLFVVLKELEHKYLSGKSDHANFWRTNKDLAKDSGMSIGAMKRAKAELIRKGIIKTDLRPFLNADGRLSEKHVCSYRIMI